jgi:hypothetical protein
MKADPRCPSIPVAVATPHKIVEKMDDKILDRMAAGLLPEPVSQGVISQTLDYYRFVQSWRHPPVQDFPAGCDIALTVKAFRGAIEAAVARNGAVVYGMMQGRRGVYTDRVTRRKMPELLFLVALRTQLALPHDDVLHYQPAQGECCTCHHHTELHSGFEPHVYGCGHGAGDRNRRHTAYQNIMVKNMRKTAMQLFDDRDVTVPGISKRAKIADFLASFDGVKFLGDFTVFCSIGATVLGKVNQVRRGNEIALHDAIARKADTYLQEATSRGEVLLALGVGHHGNFKERSPLVIKGLDPKKRRSRIFTRIRQTPRCAVPCASR